MSSTTAADSPLIPETQAAKPKDPLGALLARTGPYLRSGMFGRAGKRILGMRDSRTGHCYHVMSRTCSGPDGTLMLDEMEKEGLRKLIWKMCSFFGIELLTYCVMGNHFHALVHVPDPKVWLQQFDGPMGEERLIEHLRGFYSKDFVDRLLEEMKKLREQGVEYQAVERLEAFKRRFCDLGIWMKELKERFSRWYNRRHQRKGTMWMARYKSVLVEGSESRGQGQLDALRTMALYIDLNPVRAGLVSDPGDYRWSGYGEALGGSVPARAGLCKVVDGLKANSGWRKCGPAYGMWLFDVGKTERGSDGSVAKVGVDPKLREKVLAEFGQMNCGELLLKRVKYLTDGAVLGGKAFVEGIFEGMKDRYRRRKRGAMALGQSGGTTGGKTAEGSGLCVLNGGVG